jgi:hypothetical protein
MTLPAFQLGGAFAHARRSVVLAAASSVFSLWLAACGGSTQEDAASSSASLPITVTGADEASVSFRALDEQKAREVTIRVARDSSGAPPLGEGYLPISEVYQFTPLGWVEAAIELRIPVPANDSASGTPRLLIALPGGEWSEVSEARREGGFLVARVPHLAYATVASRADEGVVDRIRAFAAGNTAAARRLSLSFDAAATTPALPEPDANHVVAVTRATQLGLRLQYALPSGCTVAPKVGAYAAVWNQHTRKLRVIQLGQQTVSATSGSASYALPLSASDNGTWVFTATAVCKEPGKYWPRYATISAGPWLQVHINSDPVTPPPVITTAPQDLSVIEGDAVAFTVAAQGESLAYEWQRSNDGGASYAAVAGASSASLNLTATLADNAALFRVRVSNANGAATSTPARLSVATKVIAPAVTSDPANQSVIEGETASFSVAGSGTPAPTVQWQKRAATSANADPNAGWVDVAGATSATYTTAPTALAQSGSQYRAALRNSGGAASSLAATLSVQPRVVAPSIVSQPTSREVFAGEFGLFSVSASGTSPLSYQWFKNGAPITGENASELRLYADPADVGSTYQVRVRISNSAGTLDSAAATLTVQTPGTRVSAAEGGTVEGANGVSLDVPPGAFGGDTTLAVVSEAVAPGSLPEGVIALSDLVEIKPAGLRFAAPATLAFTITQDIPSGMALAVIDPATGNAAQGVRRQAALAAVAERGASNRGLTASARILARARIAAFSLPSNLACQSVQNVSARGIFKLSAIASAIRAVVVAVPESACSAISVLPLSGSVPLDTTNACTNENQFGFVGAKLPEGLSSEESSLLNRHVDCRAAESAADYLWADMLKDANGELTGNVASASADPATTESVQVASVRFEFQVSTSGPSTVLGKSVRYRARVIKYDQTGFNNYKGPSKPDVYLRAQPSCYAVGDSGFPQPASASCDFTPKPIRVSGGGQWSDWADMPVRMGWVNAPGDLYDMAFFRIQLTLFDARIAGSDDQFRRPGLRQPYVIESTLGTLPVLRCDRGLAKVGSSGCVFPQAAPVYVLDRADRSVAEAAEHIFEAQTGPLQSPGNYLPKVGTRAIAANSGNALQRAKSETVQEENRKRSCRAADSLINFRIPTNQSAKCAANSQVCSCDEYPFASTWNGGRFGPARTSAKRINADQNRDAGSGKLTGFYTSQRVLDFTQYPEQVQPYDPSAETNRGGDDFYVVVK